MVEQFKFAGWMSSEYAVVYDVSTGSYLQNVPLATLQKVHNQGLLGTYQTYENWIKSGGQIQDATPTQPPIPEWTPAHANEFSDGSDITYLKPFIITTQPTTQSTTQSKLLPIILLGGLYLLFK